MKIKAYIGDITNVPEVDVIVNAAKRSLEGGGGVDGAIHKAAGHKLLKACLKFPALDTDPVTGEPATIRALTGETRITPAFDLPNDYVIHVPGPVYSDYKPAVAKDLLRRCYQNSMSRALTNGCTSIAFPAISTGIYGFPLEDATIVAVKSVIEMEKNTAYSFSDMTVHFVCFDETNFLVYDKIINAASRNWRIEHIFE